MREKINQLLHTASMLDVSDIHFVLKNQRLQVTMRTTQGLKEVHSTAYDVSLFNYLKYLSHLDLGSGMNAQSGNFQYQFLGDMLYFRFSLLNTLGVQTGVLRILNNHPPIAIDELSENKKNSNSFFNWTRQRSGLVVLSGPTGSGKTTTLHALLHQIAAEKHLRVVSLEDPIEIFDDSYLQLQINEKHHFSYEEGIRQLMRHDPDVIMIGEIRDAQTAKMLLRSALSGHMIFTTVHAKCCSEAIKRLMELGLRKEDLVGTLSAVCAQRLYGSTKKKGRVCIYEILEGEDLSYYFQKGELPKQHMDIFSEIKRAVDNKQISDKEAIYDLPSK